METLSLLGELPLSHLNLGIGNFSDMGWLGIKSEPLNRENLFDINRPWSRVNALLHASAHVLSNATNKGCWHETCKPGVTKRMEWDKSGINSDIFFPNVVFYPFKLLWAPLGRQNYTLYQWYIQQSSLTTWAAEWRWCLCLDEKRNRESYNLITSLGWTYIFILSDVILIQCSFPLK